MALIIVFLQTTELQKDRVKVASTTIKNVLANPDKETAELIRAAKEDYESEYVSCNQVQDTYECYQCIPEYIFQVHFD